MYSDNNNKIFKIMNLHIETENMSAEFTKYHIKGLPVDTVIHHFNDIDKGDYHDHPFSFTSFVISGSYVEEVIEILGKHRLRSIITRKAGDSFYIPANHIHKIIELPQGNCTTLIVPGKWERQPLFWRFENGQAFNRICHEKDAEFKLYEI